MKKLLFLILFLFLFLPFRESKAEVTCSGSNCSAIPAEYFLKLGDLDYALQTQYVNQITNSMVEANIVTIVSSSFVGTGFTDDVEFGVVAGAGGVYKKSITVRGGGYELPDLPNAGISFSPSAEAAFNLGWVVTQFRDNPAPAFLNDISLYFYFMDTKSGYADFRSFYASKDKFEGSAATNKKGLTIRYRILKSFTIFPFFLGFSGLNLGAGFSSLRNDVSLSHYDKPNPTVNFGPFVGTWDTRTNFGLHTKGLGTILDLRTGFDLFYFFTLVLGGGYSDVTSEVEINAKRAGPFEFKLSSYSNNASMFSPDAYKYFYDYSKQNETWIPGGFLSFDMRDKAKLKRGKPFGVVGLQFNLLFFHVLAEAYYLDKARAFNVGIKMGF